MNNARENYIKNKLAKLSTDELRAELFIRTGSGKGWHNS